MQLQNNKWHQNLQTLLLDFIKNLRKNQRKEKTNVYQTENAACISFSKICIERSSTSCNFLHTSNIFLKFVYKSFQHKF